MSVTKTATHTCTVCKDSYKHGYRRGYCSDECYYREKGEKALNSIRNAHVWCSTCGRVRAEVDPPKPDDQFAIEESYGAAWHTDQDGNVSYEKFTQEESAQAAIGQREATMNEEEGCVCGTLERTGDGHFDILHDVETFDTLLRIHDRIKEAAIDGQREDWPSRGTLFRVYRETGDLAYAVGRAL